MKLAKTYQPNQFESTIYAMWEMSNAFSPKGEGEPYSIVMPPPNANGNLHIGHALATDLQDILVRYYRMQGRPTAYIPGADHAGFETWIVFERELNKQGKSRTDFSREELYRQVWDFVASKRGDMEIQLRALGASCSWQDLVFTLDPKVIDTVYSTFKKLWDEGLIYRDKKIVNYSTAYQTSYADIEVDYKEVEGTLYSIAYPLVDDLGEIIVATTRPETMLGDTAIAVNPDDERYKHLIGKHAMVPIVDREVPIIADSYVDMNYGTGAVKVTPAHDPNDFEIGQRHNLEVLQVIDFDGRMINVPSTFLGVPADVARAKVVTILEASDSLESKKPIKHVVGFDYKSGLPIEPMVKEQWFLKVQPLAERAIKAISEGEIKFYPESKKQVVINYLKKLRDWNLSRQIAWGIPIPAFVNTEDSEDWIFDTRVNQELIEVGGKTYRREEDTFDTWFSSGQWPFITTDKLNNGKLSQFYPNSVMETGFDLLDRWVARMIMLGLYTTNQVPFKEVYMHGMVLDAQGQKMSKSKGNVINPMEIVTKYGSDALRLGIIANRSAGQSQAFLESNVVAGRNFCNKLWNIARFILDIIPAGFTPSAPEELKLQSEADHWIIERLAQTINKLADHMAKYRFAEAGELVYQTIWNDVADWYLEASKQQQNLPVLAHVLSTILKIAHPFAPFITEVIWQSTGWNAELLINQNYPKAGDVVYNPEIAQKFNDLKQIIEEVRVLLKDLPARKEKYSLGHLSDELLSDNKSVICHLAGVADVRVASEPSGVRITGTTHQAWIEADAHIVKRYQSSLEERLNEARARLMQLNQRLSNPSYVDKAPEHLVRETRNEVAQTEEKISRLEAQLQA